MTNFVRVKDPTTKHQFDLPADHHLIQVGAVELLKSDRYPDSSRPRAPKHHRPAKGRTHRTATPDEAGDAESTEDTPSHPGTGTAQDRPAGRNTTTEE